MEQSEVVPTLLDAIAEIEGTHPEDLSFTLYEHINPDAINQLATSGHTDWELQFEVPDHTVEVHGDGAIFVDGVPLRAADRVPMTATSHND